MPSMAPAMKNSQKDLSTEGLRRLTEVYEQIEAASMTGGRPFSVQATAADAVTSDLWGTPPTFISSRETGFDWSKPDKAGAERLAGLAAVERARQLQGALVERERDIRVLRRRLVEANRHRATLGEALQRYEGKPTWEELNGENTRLREQLEQTSRDLACHVTRQQRERVRVASSLRHQLRHRLAP